MVEEQKQLSSGKRRTNRANNNHVGNGIEISPLNDDGGLDSNNGNKYSLSKNEHKIALTNETIENFIAS
ncbi:CLUMA_CG004060, isoform A [Clunio marinus]|uniref:CLUMA_CG004060, isoform A n=1 Tax=Clunio marinus TaxID=568069 RepID=A0A1J1HQH2_9DIPT|nr:CLUMA_CG004060, isoform A [Clunio marinus]